MWCSCNSDPVAQYSCSSDPVVQKERTSVRPSCVRPSRLSCWVEASWSLGHHQLAPEIEVGCFPGVHGGERVGGRGERERGGINRRFRCFRLRRRVHRADVEWVAEARRWGCARGESSGRGAWASLSVQRHDTCSQGPQMWGEGEWGLTRRRHVLRGNPRRCAV